MNPLSGPALASSGMPGPLALLADLNEPELLRWWSEAVAEPGSVFAEVTITEILRHLPDRRVTMLGRRGGDVVVVKVFSSPRARGNHRRLLALAASSTLRGLVPTSIGVSTSGHVGLLDFTPGQILEHLRDDAFVAKAAEVGQTLASLHASPADLDRSWTHHDEVAQLLRRMPTSGLAQAQVESARPVSDAALVPSHRDFHPRQVVVDDVVKLIDLDDAALAPAGLDVGNMVAHLRREAVAGRRTTEVAEAAIAGFLGGYGAPPADLDVWERLSLTRLAGLAESRHLDPGLRDGLLAVLAARPVPATPSVSEEVATGHDDRPVRIVTPAEGAAYVSKRYLSTDGAAIHEAMVDLWASSFGKDRLPAPGLPEPLSFDVRRGELRMALAAGDPLGARGDLGASVARGAEAATLLADLHASGVTVGRVRDPRSLARSALRKARDRAASPIGDELAGTVDLVGAQLTSAPDDLDLVLTHGDFSPRNVLATPERLTLIDFDRLQLSSPLRDVAYWTTWLWATATTQGVDSAGGWALGEDFVAAYARRSGLDLEAHATALAGHRAMALIRIVHGWSSLRADHDAARQMLAEARDLVDASLVRA